MSDLPTETDVLIVGAGPAGLALAAELKRLRVSPLIIDEQTAIPSTSRAAVVHARTLEVLEPLGVSSELVAQGVKVPMFRVRDRDRVLIAGDFAQIPSAYRFALMCPQEKTEHTLLNRLQQLGGRVVRPCEFVGVDGSETHLRAELRADGASRMITARWLVGCDGMHSRVREQAGIAFVGAAYEQSFVLADVHMDWPLGREEVSLFLSPDGLVVVAPLPESRFRIVAAMDDAPEQPSAVFMQTLLDKRGPLSIPGRMHDVVWSSRFRIHHRVAERSRQGRILLCGDAAHVHSPAGGQGMNTGIQDSVSLASVLAETIGDGDEARLDSWAARRHRLALDVVALTDRLTRMATIKSRPFQRLRNTAIALAGRVPPIRTALARRLAELDAR
jgi:2-polyprenyl-6-methoxyphenol hydroxylase-like FAD-dependent oxidoreductase